MPCVGGRRLATSSFSSKITYRSWISGLPFAQLVCKGRLKTRVSLFFLSFPLGSQANTHGISDRVAKVMVTLKPCAYRASRSPFFYSELRRREGSSSCPLDRSSSQLTLFYPNPPHLGHWQISRNASFSYPRWVSYLRVLSLISFPTNFITRTPFEISTSIAGNHAQPVFRVSTNKRLHVIKRTVLLIHLEHTPSRYTLALKIPAFTGSVLTPPLATVLWRSAP